MCWFSKSQQIREIRQPTFEDVKFVELAAWEVSSPVFGSPAEPLSYVSMHPYSRDFGSDFFFTYTYADADTGQSTYANPSF